MSSSSRKKGSLRERLDQWQAKQNAGEPHVNPSNHLRHRTQQDRIELHRLLEDNGIKFCLINIEAMNFWGVPKVKTEDYDLCVDSSQLELATDVLVSSGLYERDGTRLSRKDVNFHIRLIPSSSYDLDISVDCVEDPIPGTTTVLRAPKPARLIHALLFTHVERGLVEVEYLFMHNTSWGEEILDELSEEDAEAVRPILRNRAEQMNKTSQAFLLGKWDHVTDEDKLRLRYAF